MGSLSGEAVVMQNVANPAIRDEEDATWFTDANYFSFFSFPLLEGDPAEVLKQPFTAVITTSMAKKYFGTTDAVGRQLRFNGKYIFVVAGVMADAPSNSSIQPDFLLSVSSMAGIESMKSFVTDDRGFGGLLKPISNW